MAYDIFHPTEAHRDLRNLVQDLGKGVLALQAKEHDEKETFNEDLLRRFGKEYGLFGITIPEKDGGHGLDATAAVIVHEELSRFDPAFTLSYLAHEVLFVNNLYYSAQEDLRKKYIPLVTNGDYLAGMAMTEPEAGTDVLGMKTTAKRDGDYYILNGTKQFITNAECGDVFLVYAKIDPENSRSITSFVVEKTFEGVSVGKKEEKMGMKQSPTGQLIFEDAKVPLKNRIGEEGGALVHMMRNLEIERLTLAAMSLGIAKESLEIMINYAVNEREAFGKKLSAFGQIQQMIGESFSRFQASRALVYNTALNVNPARRESLMAASAKLSATQMAEFVSRCAIQVLGGYGYTRDYPLERLHRDSILLSIGGGTNEAMQKNIMADLRRLYSQ